MRGRQAVRHALSPTGLTVALAAVLAGVGALLLARTPEAPLLAGPTGAGAAVLVVELAVAFFVTELAQALVEVRRQAYSFSLAGIPLLVGLLYCPPEELVVVRLVAAAAAFAVQRAAPLKFAFNLASYLLDAALVIVLAHVLVDGAALSLTTAAQCYLAVAVTDLVMSCCVLLVIRINQGPVTGGDVVGILVPASVFVVVNTSIAFTGVVLLHDGPLGSALLIGFVLLTVAGYRGYLVLRRRHSSLQTVQRFAALSARVEQDHGLVSSGESSAQVVELLDHVRTALRASSVELLLTDDDRAVEHVVGEGTVSSRTSDRRAHDLVVASVLHTRDAVLLDGRSRDDTVRTWLAATGRTDALVVSLTSAGTDGVLIASDRVGDTTSFTVDDLALLQTLGGHLAVAVRNARLVAQLRHEATHDVLTGLPNRELLTERVTAALAAPGGLWAAVLLLDVDRFKDVNDALGHHVGDQLLQVVAARLSGLDLPGATVTRLGGDEFAVLLTDVADLGPAALDVAARIDATLSDPVELTDATVSTSASIGVAVAGPGGSGVDLLRHADTAMYAAKGRGTAVVLYSDDLDQGRAERLSLLADLHRALLDDDLVLHYQPKLDLCRGEVTSVEALVRWTHPRLGPLPPDAFVPLAESTGLIELFTEVVLAKALRQARAWLDDGLDIAVAVNLSARNVGNPALPQNVAAALALAGVPAGRLILEITESSVMADPEHAVAVLRELAGSGVTLSLDDFGTGYSSLSYLQRLPVQEVKIDRSFVAGLEDRVDEGRARTSAALIRSVTTLKETFGLRIVAEGVEEERTLGLLRELGVDLAQGYHVGRPAPAHALPVALCARSADGVRPATHLAPAIAHGGS